ncbi:TMF-regulated nuclear protein 1 [Rhinophrynus dorsalis]
MPLAQGNAFWNLQRVFTNPRSAKVPQSTVAKPVSLSNSPSFWKSSNVSNLFHRRTSTTPCTSPKRSTSAPHEIPLKSYPDPCAPSAPDTSTKRETAAPSNILSKSTSIPHTFHLNPNSPNVSPNTPCTSHSNPYALRSRSAVPNHDLSQTQVFSPPSSPSVSPTHKISSLRTSGSPCTMPQNSSPTSSAVATSLATNNFSSGSSTLQSLSKVESSVSQSKTPYISFPSISFCPPTSPPPQSPSCIQSPASSPHKSSPIHSPLKSPSPHSSRKASTQEHALPVAKGPPGSELVEARRRLLAVEGRRRALCALEMRVQQVHYVFLQAEMRVARQREGLARLREAAGRAEVQAAVHGQRLRRAMRHHKPRLLACALCVPWAGKVERRVVQHPRHARCAVFQGRVQVLRACVRGEESG